MHNYIDVHVCSLWVTLWFLQSVSSYNSFLIFGTGAFLSVLNDVQAGQLKLDEHLLGQVRDLYNKASLIGQRALPFLKQSTPDYFKKFRKQVSNPWANFKPFTNKELLKRNYNPHKRRNIISFDEETSDQCMSALTGTGSNSHITQPCQVSDKCWGVISAEGAEGYALTHQALFFLLGETQGNSDNHKNIMKLYVCIILQMNVVFAVFVF